MKCDNHELLNLLELIVERFKAIGHSKGCYYNRAMEAKSNGCCYDWAMKAKEEECDCGWMDLKQFSRSHGILK